MIIYGLKNCDTCRKALKSLDGAQLADVRTTEIPADVLQNALDLFGDALVNRRSTTWRNLSEDERALSPIALLRAQPSVMKRPLILAGDSLYLGWTPETRAALGAD